MAEIHPSQLLWGSGGGGAGPCVHITCPAFSFPQGVNVTSDAQGPRKQHCCCASCVLVAQRFMAAKSHMLGSGGSHFCGLHLLIPADTSCLLCSM